MTRRTSDDRTRSRWITSNAAPVAVVVLALCAHLTLVAHRCWIKSPTVDEVAHLAAALSHVEFATFDVYRVNPPLSTLPAGLVLIQAAPRMDWAEYKIAARGRPEFDLGATLARLNADRYRRLVFKARLACLPWTILGLLVAAIWAWKLYGPWAGAMAAGLWAFCPETIAHASIVTPDLAAASCSLLAAFALDRWLRATSWATALWSGIALGIALLTKFTLLLYIPLWPLIAGLWWLLHERSDWKQLRRRAAQMILMLSAALLVLNAGYGFEGTGIRLNETTYWSDMLGGDGASLEEPNDTRFTGTWLAQFPLPIPRNVLLGIDAQRFDFETGFNSYLGGQWREHGWWYYYLVAAAVKLPLALWFLAFLALCRGGSNRGELVVILPGLALLIFVSSQTGFSAHFRYVLPALPFLLIYTSRLASPRIGFPSGLGRAVVIAACALQIAATWRVHPHELSYFNPIAGGPRGGHDYLVDSNIDWGQDLWLLQDWMEQHRHKRPLGLAYYGGFIQPSWFGIKHALPPFVYPPEDPTNPPTGNGPQPGLYAISVTLLRGRTQVFVPDGHGEQQYIAHPVWTYFYKHFEPTATAGYSIYIYDLSREEVNRVRRQLNLPVLPNSPPVPIP